MKELRVLIEAKKAVIDGECVSAWFTLPINETEFEEILLVDADSEDYRILEMKLPFPEEVTEETPVDRLNDLYYIYKDLSSDFKEGLEELLTYFTNMEELYQHRYDIISYPNCNSMIDIARYVLSDNPAFHSLSEECVRYFDFEAYGQHLEDNRQFIETEHGIFEILC